MLLCTSTLNHFRFNGVTIRPSHLSEVNVDSFSQLLSVSLETWKQDGRRGVWIKIPTHQSELIPIATKVRMSYGGISVYVGMSTHMNKMTGDIVKS